MKKFLIGIVTLVAAVMLSSSAFGALATSNPFNKITNATFYFDVGVDLDEILWAQIIPPVPADPDSAIGKMPVGWGEITHFERFDSDSDPTLDERAKFDSDTGIWSVKFTLPVENVLAFWGEQGPTSYAFQLGSPTNEFGWILHSEDAMSHVDGNNAVPVPAAVWLLGSGVLGLVAIRRRRS